MKDIANVINEFFDEMGIKTSFGVFTWHPEKPEAGNIIVHGNQQDAIKAMQTKICELQIQGSFPAPINTEPV